MTENARGRTLTYEDLSRCFHLPINAAAKELGVCVTALKKQCRKHGVPRWPHRKLKSLDKLKEKLEKEEATAADKEYYKHEIHSITQKKDHIFRSSSTNANSSSANGSAPLAHMVGAPPPGTLHPRPGHPLMLGHPMAGYHAPTLPPKLASTTVPSRNSASGEADRQQQQHQHIIAGPVLMPVAQIPGAGAAAAIPGPNGTLIPQPMQGPPQQYSLCGIYGDDYYVNNGVPSRMYHPPLPVPRPNGAATPNGAGPSHASTMPNVHYFNPPAYAYAPTMTSMAPYQNMVQVNVVEQPAFAHGSNRPAQPSSTARPSSPQTGKPVPNSSVQQKGGAKHPGKPTAMGFEMYGGIPQPVPAHNGIMYNFVPHNVHYEGMVQHQSNGAPIHGPVPGYWSEMQHSQTPASNLVNMLNQTVHHHHHHGSAPASPCLAQKDTAGSDRQDVDNASSKTNESERMETSNDDKKISNAGKTDGATTLVDMQSKNSDPSRVPNQTQSAASQAQGGVHKESNKDEGASLNRKTEKSSGSIPMASTQRTVSSRTQSESKGGNSEICANGYPPKGLPNGTQSHATSDSTCYSSRSDENKENHQGSSKRPNKRLRTQLAPEQNEIPNGRRFSSTTTERPSLTGIDGPKLSAPTEARRPVADEEKTGRNCATVTQNAHSSSRKESQLSNQTGTASVIHRARRFDQVVHQCLALASVQWSTDLSFKVTLAIGPKAMLGLAGVPSLGKNVLEGTDTALEDRASTKKRYVLAAEGKRLEWIVTNGNTRYLTVMNPQRMRNSKELIGVAGLMVELKIIQAL